MEEAESDSVNRNVADYIWVYRPPQAQINAIVSDIPERLGLEFPIGRRLVVAIARQINGVRERCVEVKKCNEYV